MDCVLYIRYMWTACYISGACGLCVIYRVYVDCVLYIRCMCTVCYISGACRLCVIYQVHVDCELYIRCMWTVCYISGACGLCVIYQVLSDCDIKEMVNNFLLLCLLEKFLYRYRILAVNGLLVYHNRG